MCTAGPNNKLWLTEAPGVDTNGCDMPNNDTGFALFGAIADVVCRSAWGQNKEFEMF